MKIRSLLLLGLALTLALLISLLAMTVSGESAECPVELLPGASVRLDENHSGLRFESRILTEELAELGDVTLGTLILPTDLKNGPLTVNTEGVIDLTNAQRIEKADGYTYFYAAIVDILPQNYTRDFTAVSYIKIGSDYYYTAESTPASIYDVAKAAYADKYAGNAIISGYLDRVLVLTKDLEISVPAGYVSPYEVSYASKTLSIRKAINSIDLSALATVMIGDRTFTGGWSLSGDALVAPYTRTYPVTFKSGATTLGVVEIPEGTLPSYPGSVPAKGDNAHTGWYPYLTEVTGPATYEATFESPNALGVHMKLPASVVEYALAQALIDYGNEYATGRNGQKTNPFNGTSSVVFLLVEEHFNPGQKAVGERILAQLRSVLTSGHEPDMILGSEWSPANFAVMIALAEKTPTVWNSLTSLEKEKLEYLLTLLTYSAAFTTNDVNNYKTILNMTGGYAKTWNPNYILTNVIPMLAAGEFFGGADAVDELLLAFDHETVLAKCQAYGFVNPHRIFSIPPTDLLENGGTAYHVETGNSLGSGAGIRAPYLYKTHSLDEPEKILNELLSFTFSGGRVVSGYSNANGDKLAYIISGDASPYEDMLGMYLEFAGSDSAGPRSSASYCLADFNMTTMAFLMMVTTGSYDLDTDMSQSMKNMVWVGNSDLIFKLENGYQSYANGKTTEQNYLGSYAATTPLKTLWEDLLFAEFVSYSEESDPYVLTYVMPNGTVFSDSSRSGTVTLSSALASGYLWFDGTRFYKNGATYTFANGGEITMRAVQSSGVADGAYLIGSSTGNVTLAAGSGSGASSSWIDAGLSGKVLTVVTISSPTNEIPNYLQFQHKVNSGGNKDSLIFGIRNNGTEIQSSSGAKVCSYNGSKITLALAYDTAASTGKIYIKNGDSWTYAADFTNNYVGSPITRLGFIYITQGYSNNTQKRTVSYTATHYYGLTSPLSFME